MRLASLRERYFRRPRQRDLERPEKPYHLTRTPPDMPVGMNGDHEHLRDLVLHVNSRVDVLFIAILGLYTLLLGGIAVAVTVLVAVLTE